MMGRQYWISMVVLVLATAGAGRAVAGDAVKLFGRGVEFSPDDLPDSELRRKLKSLDAAAYGAAMNTLKKINFTENEVGSIRVNQVGDVHMVCRMPPEAVAFRRALAAGRAVVAPAPIAQVPVPITAPPVFHSRRGSPRVIYLDFSGHVVQNTQWNTEYTQPVYNAPPLDLDDTPTSFNDAEQLFIKRVWKRVAEDFAPFDVDVTTEEPTVFTNTTCRVLITKGQSRNGTGQLIDNPGIEDEAVGIAYLSVFGNANYQTRQPVWVYYDGNLNAEDRTSETVSHEVGHNLGLSHDGSAQDGEYYRGHGVESLPISWAPIMGFCDLKNVTQWSRGQYFQSTNTQDDLTIISGRLGYRPDDHVNVNAGATPLILTNGSIINSTTPENDPTNASPQNKGVIERTADVDVFSFITGTGRVTINVNPYIAEANTRGGNLDIKVELRNFTGQVVATADRSDTTVASITYDAQAGNYYIAIEGVGTGTPEVSPPTGYTDYASLGQYFISGTVQPFKPGQGEPSAGMNNTRLTTPGGATLQFDVIYFDNAGIDATTLDSNDLRIIGPNGYNQPATFISALNGLPLVATYSMAAPGGTWDSTDNGTYNVVLQANQVANVGGLFATAGLVGTIQISINSGVPVANDDSAATVEGQPVTVNVLANDVSNDPPFVIRIVTPPQHGTAVVNADNTITYTPTPGYSGPDSLVYGLIDTEIESDLATLSITVASSAPVITSPLMVNALQGIPFRYVITLTGTQPIQISVAPLPPGTTLNGNEITGLIPAGSYSMTITATNASGSDIRTVVINASLSLPNVDTDGDGFPDEMELTFGSDPVSPGSTPLTVLNKGGVPPDAFGQRAPIPFALGRTGLMIKLDFKSDNADRDRITLNGTLPVPSDYAVLSQPIAAFIGGAGVSGTLNLRGQYSSQDKLVRIKVGKPRIDLEGRNAPFTVQMKGVYASLLSDEGLNNFDTLGTKVNIPVYVILGTRYYGLVTSAFYTARLNKAGSAKAENTEKPQK